jgi:hypothetical protein
MKREKAWCRPERNVPKAIRFTVRTLSLSATPNPCRSLDYICSMIISNKEKRQCTQNGSNVYKKTFKTPMMRNLVIVYTFKVAMARSTLCSETMNIAQRENDTHTYSCLRVPEASRGEQSSHRTQINGNDRVFVAQKHTLHHC